MARFECKIIGIDLGTTNTAAAYYEELGKLATCCPNREGTNLLDSVVGFENSKTYLVGKVAREGALLNPHYTVLRNKRNMGSIKVAITVDGKSFSPQQVSALILKEAVENVYEELEENITDVVITVPAYFNSAARRATLEAGEMAGLRVRAILNEPDAAVYHYALHYDLKGGRILVFDLGGGTLDLAAAEVSETEISEIAVNGDIHLGGADWDQAFVRYIKETYLKGRTLAPDDEQALILDAERAKKTLSRKEKTRINVSTKEGRISAELTRTEFDKCTAHLLERVRGIIQELMSDLSGKGAGEIDKIIMVGGSTRMPQIEQLLREMFPGTDILAKDQDEAVAKGAAVYAKLLSMDFEGKELPEQCSFKPKRLQRISSRSYGLAVQLGEGGEQKIYNMISRSAELPASKWKTFFTSCENPKQVNFKVYETTSNEQCVDIDPDALLGNCVLEMTEDIPKGSAIEVIFTLDENGVFQMEGREPKSGRSVKAVMESKTLLSADEIMAQKREIELLTRAY